MIQRLLDADVVSGSLTTTNLSRFGARRLFARLQSFDALRELSGRPTFSHLRALTVGARMEKEDVQRMLVDTELEHLPPQLRWREWLLCVEAVFFAAGTPVSRETLARVVGKDCNLA